MFLIYGYIDMLNTDVDPDKFQVKKYSLVRPEDQKKYESVYNSLKTSLQKRSKSLAASDQDLKTCSAILTSFIQLVKSMIDKHFTCAVCQSSVQDPIILECTHLFCGNCLENWLVTVQTKGQFKTCPVCRKFVREPIFSVLSLGSFISKVDAVNNFFNQQQQDLSLPNHHHHRDQGDKLLELLKILELPCKFKSIMTVWNLCPESVHGQDDYQQQQHMDPVTMKTKKSLACIELIRLLRDLDISQLAQRLKKPQKNILQTISKTTKDVYKMIFPWHEQLMGLMIIILYQIIPLKVQSWLHLTKIIGRHHNHHRWKLTPPNCLCYCWMVASIIYFYVIFNISHILINERSKPRVKELLKHVTFSFFDAPSYETVQSVVEAVNLGIEVVNMD